MITFLLFPPNNVEVSLIGNLTRFITEQIEPPLCANPTRQVFRFSEKEGLDKILEKTLSEVTERQSVLKDTQFFILHEPTSGQLSDYWENYASILQNIKNFKETYEIKILPLFQKNLEQEIFEKIKRGTPY